MNRKVRVTLTLSKDVLKRINKLAKGVGLSRSSFVEMVFTVSKDLESMIANGIRKASAEEKTETETQ